jgi:ketosteroid isomerase-like protein
MSDLQAIADRVEIEALRGEFTDAVMMRDYDRLASLFTPDGALRMPNVPAELAGREEIRAWGERVPALVEQPVQTTHRGTSQLDGDPASGRATSKSSGAVSSPQEVLVEERGMEPGWRPLAPLATVGTVRRDGQEHAAGAAAMIRRAPPRPAARLVVGGRG